MRTQRALAFAVTALLGAADCGPPPPDFQASITYTHCGETLFFVDRDDPCANARTYGMGRLFLETGHFEVSEDHQVCVHDSGLWNKPADEPPFSARITSYEGLAGTGTLDVVYTEVSERLLENTLEGTVDVTFPDGRTLVGTFAGKGCGVE